MAPELAVLAQGSAALGLEPQAPATQALDLVALDLAQEQV